MPFLAFNKIASCFFAAGLLFFGVFQEAGGGEPPANRAEILYKKAQGGYYHLKSSGENRVFRRQWMACIKKFITVYERYPASPQAYKALFTAARLFHQLYGVAKSPGDRDKAGDFYYKVVSEFKDGWLTDDALFYQGQIFFDSGDYSAALSLFEKILLEYPHGDQISKAKKLKEAAVPFVRAREKARPSSVSPPVLIKKVDFSSGRPHSTRIVVHTSGSARVSRNRLIGPERVYFNFLNARLDEGIEKNVQIGGDILDGLRLSQFDETTSRLVLDIGTDKDVKIHTSHEDAKIVIDLFTSGKKSTLAVKPKPASPHKEVSLAAASISRTGVQRPIPHKKSIIAVKTKRAATLKAAVPAAASRSKTAVGERIPLIVVDPGHGGKDFGAKSPNSLFEKDVTLDISKRLRNILEVRYGYSVVLTRGDDRFISLEERGAIANEKDADLFVSIHVNASRRRSAHGIETFYLGAANSAQAQETAARENGELVNSVKDNQVQQILASLISAAKKNDSAMLAGRIQDRLRKSITMKYAVKDRGAKEGPFFVLHDTNMPSVIVEVGFITNSSEERRLRKSRYLDRLASSIAAGIHEFKKDRGPTI